MDHLGGERYAVSGTLGEGSQGTTYAATELATGRAVAIKRFDVRGARSWKDVELAEREIRVLESLDHPLVPRYVEHFEEDGALYLVMERVQGETLEAIRKREGALPEAEVRRFLASADRTLTYLHGRGSPVVHRDVKPANVVRRADGSYVLVDFGAVSEQLRRGTGSTVVGTLGYMAPEQLQGRGLPASDVYAVGATALAALTGLEPEKLPHRGLRVDVQAAVGGRASPDLVASLKRMLEPDPDLRAPSLAAALDGPATVGTSSGSRPAPASAAARIERTLVPGEQAGEDAAVKSLRGLMWALWGLGWVIVPLVFGKMLGMPEGIPIVMFGWMALIFVVTWHRGAMLRALVRAWRKENASSIVRQRVDSLPAQQVRVHTAKLAPEEALAGTEVQGDEGEGRRRRAR
jgi:Protein kinase domain